MSQRSYSNVKNQQKGSNNLNTIENLRDFGSSMVKNAGRDLKQLGTGMFDQFFGGYNYDYDKNRENGDFHRPEAKKQSKRKQEFKVFNYQEYYEREIIKRQIKELTEAVKKEIELIKKADAALLNDIKDVQKLAVDQAPEKPGVYHIHFMEIVLGILRSLRAKVNESRTWLSAMTSKKKKRGSLFANLSKKKGTQYSLSQELQTSRSVQ